MLNTNDISRFVTEIPGSKQALSQIGQIITNDIPTIKGDSHRGFWDVRNPISPFYGNIGLNFFTLNILQDGLTAYSGNIKTIRVDNSSNIADVELISPLQSALDHGCIYLTASTTGETPSEAIANIAIAYGLTIDPISFGYATRNYNSNSAYIAVYLVNPDTTVAHAFQQILEIGCATMYAINGVLYYSAWESKTSSASYTFSTTASGTSGVTLWGPPNVTQLEKQLITGYSFQTTQGPATGGINVTKGKNINGGNDAPVRILSLQAGNYFGGQWLAYLKAQQSVIKFKCNAKIARQLQLLTPISIAFTTGNWNTVTADITSIDNTSLVVSEIEATTRG